MTIEKLPAGFVLLQKREPTLIIDLKYSGSDNIVGRPIVGYAADGQAILTEDAAYSLSELIKTLQSPAICREMELSSPTLLILDAYRPQMAVDDFWQWSQSDCQKTKSAFYPHHEKNTLFAQGYFAKQSSHSRGSTVDLTIVDRRDGKIVPLDMGTPFDFMDELSHPDNPAVSATAFRHRQFLKKLMMDFGWLGVHLEWWHFTFQEEPFPDTYFNFPVIDYPS